MRRPTSWAAVLAALGAAVAVVLLALPSALAAPTDTAPVAVAGTGSDGPLQNDISATLAQLWGPSDVALIQDQSGAKHPFIADRYHHQVRWVDAADTIRSSLGSGQPNCTNLELNQPGGITSDGQGGYYVSSSACQTVTHVDATGTALQASGRVPGDPRNCQPPPLNNQPAADVCLNAPAGLSYDAGSDRLCIANQFSHQILVTSGGFTSVLAGVGETGPVSLDVVAAHATFNYPRATGLALAADGDLWVAGGASGQISRINTLTGAVTAVATLPGSLGGLDLDDQGNLFVADVGPANQYVYKLAGVAVAAQPTAGPPVPPTTDPPPVVDPAPPAPIVPPAPDPVPPIDPGPMPAPGGVPPPVPAAGGLVIKAATIAAAPSDRLLTRTLNVAMSDPAVRPAKYEYGWATSDPATAPASVQRCSLGATPCLLNYQATTPGKPWQLFVRAVDSAGHKGPWWSQTVVTPPAPKLIVIGDSIMAGHHRDSEGAPTICEDPAYSLGQTVWDSLQAQLPAPWRVRGGYLNLAKSGFGTNEMINGGTDACRTRSGPQLELAATALRANAGSWNWVLADGGINDTNWGSILAKIIEANIAGRIKSSAQCQAYLDAWDLASSSSMRDRIATNLGILSDKLESADPLARTQWLGYYNVAGTGTVKAKIPASCEAPMSNAISLLTIMGQKVVSTRGFDWINADSVIGTKGALLQGLYPSDIVLLSSGWPHPNREGAKKLGNAALRH